jgi:arylsulfatase A-like enzyme
MPKRANVLFIILDQLRADCVFGNLAQHVNLPNIQTLAKDSVSFLKHFSVTNPCGPSRASILTGQYAMNHRSVRNGTPLRHDIPNLATEIRKAGYVPMLFGYTDTSQDPRVHDKNDPALKSCEYPMTGFHEVVEMRQGMSYPWRSHLLDRGYNFSNYQNIYHPVSKTGGTPKINDPAFYSAEHSDTAFLTDRFLAEITNYADESWFAHLTYIRPHPPLVAPSPYNTMYDPSKLPLPTRLTTKEDEEAVHPFFGPLHIKDPVSKFVTGFPQLSATDENVQALRSIYLGLATEVDFHIGRVIQFLKDNDQYGDTMIILTSDHGEMLGDRHSWGKLSVYDAAYQTPLIIHVPELGDQAGRKIEMISESVDITPTILDWVMQSVPNSMDGRSLIPILHGEKPTDWRKYSFSELDFALPTAPTVWERILGLNTKNGNLSIIREEQFTLVQFAADLPPLLFDHSRQGEMVDVSKAPEYQETLYEMTLRLLRHRMKYTEQTLSETIITSEGAKTQYRIP